MRTTIGCDPEVFISNGYETISAYGILPGTKAEPYKVEKGAVQVDGTAFEFNIDPVTTADAFDKNISTVLAQMDEMVKKIDKSFRLTFLPVAYYKNDYFKLLPDPAKELGCDPDYNAISGAQQTPKEDLSEKPLRTASGHIHIGWTEDMRPHHPDHFKECQRIAAAFRYETFFRPRTMLEKVRFEYYGANGAFRPKSYGVELRMPSNRWVAKNETRIRVFNDVMSRYTLLKR